MSGAFREVFTLTVDLGPDRKCYFRGNMSHEVTIQTDFGNHRATWLSFTKSTMGLKCPLIHKKHSHFHKSLFTPNVTQCDNTKTNVGISNHHYWTGIRVVLNRASHLQCNIIPYIRKRIFAITRSANGKKILADYQKEDFGQLFRAFWTSYFLFDFDCQIYRSSSRAQIPSHIYSHILGYNYPGAFGY